VEDDGVGLGAHTGDGLGLAITRERLAHLYGDDHTLSLAPANGAGTRATIDIPAREASA
jgi:LytS/YehU family sensor histidine kinase